MGRPNDQTTVRHVVVLRYPNGRQIERTITARILNPGAQFTLLGRRWRVDHVVPATRLRGQPIIVCLPADQLSPLTMTPRVS